LKNRTFFGATTTFAGIITAAAIGSAATGSAKAPQTSFRVARQAMSSHIASSPIDGHVSADATHVFGTSDPTKAAAHLPLSLANGTTIEVGRRDDGLLCFDANVPNETAGGSCGFSVGTGEVAGVIDRRLGRPQLYYGLAGDDVVSLIVNTGQGAVPALVRNGVFFTVIPKDAKLSNWTATLTDGTTSTGDLSADNGNPLLNQ
jgi:hypothetical protein